MSSDRVHLSVDEARALGERALRGIGYDAEEARILADHVIDAALCGYEYSGLPRSSTSPTTAASRSRGRRCASCTRPRSRRSSTAATMSACWRCTTPREAAIAKAAAHGISMVGVTNSWMSGRSAYYVEMIARAGLVAIHTAAAARRSRRSAAPRRRSAPTRSPSRSRRGRAAGARYGHLGVYGDRSAVAGAARYAAARRRGDRPRRPSDHATPQPATAARSCRSAGIRASGWR